MPSPGRIGELPSAHDIKRLCKVIYALLSCKYSNMHSSIITQIRMTQQRLSMNCIPQTVDGSHTCTIINLFIVLIPWTFLHRDNCTAEESWIYTKLDWHYSSRKQNYILGHTFILCLFYMLNLYFMTRAAFLFYVWYSINTVLTSLRKKGGVHNIQQVTFKDCSCVKEASYMEEMTTWISHVQMGKDICKQTMFISHSC